MTAPMRGMPSPNDIAQKLLFLQRALDTGADELAAADEAFVRSKARYEQASATVTLKVAEELRGSKALAAEREALVTQQTAAEWLDVELAEARVRSLKERQRVLYAQADIVRSLNAGLRVEANLAGSVAA